MKLKEKMLALSLAVGNAERAYHRAVFEAVKKLGGSVNVLGDEDEDVDMGLRVSYINCDTTVDTIRVDRVFIGGSPESPALMVHYNEWNYQKVDDETWLDVLNDAVNYILEAIDWGDTEIDV